jgi:hypothetical protein
VSASRTDKAQVQTVTSVFSSLSKAGCPSLTQLPKGLFPAASDRKHRDLGRAVECAGPTLPSGGDESAPGAGTGSLAGQ